MFTKSLDPSAGILLMNCNSVHTFFMNYAIGVIYLSKDFNITKIVPRLERRRGSADRQAKHVLEIHPDRLQELNLKVGDILRF